MSTPQTVEQENPYAGRLKIFAGLLIGIFVVLELRLLDLQGLRHSELLEKAEIYQHTTRVEQSWRGQILDRNGIPLAVTVPVKDIYADLATWTNHVSLLAPIVAPLLGTDPASLANRVNQAITEHREHSTNSEADALLLKRDVTPKDWAAIQAALARQNFGIATNKLSSKQRDQLKDFHRWTLFSADAQLRFYPYHDLLTQVVGTIGTGTNGHLLQGRSGIEATLDAWLAGRNGVCASSQDAAGNELAFCRTEDIKAENGADVTLTIDIKLQAIVMKALSEVMATTHARSASCVVIDPNTGEILAMVSLPTFDPQSPGTNSQTDWRNHAVNDSCEVGSVFKLVTLSSALQNGVVNLDEPIFCENGHWIYKRISLRDDDHHYGMLSVRDCLAKSSNIGIAKIGLMVGTNRLYDTIQRFGFGRRTGLPLPGETPGYIPTPDPNFPGAITRLAIGQGLGVSQIQIAMAYAAIANDGTLMQPMMLKQLKHPNGTMWGQYQPKAAGQVVSPETARRVREALQAVVEHGTGTQAALPGYNIQGKTGTAQESNKHGYIPGQLYCSFIGMLPAEKPQLVIAVAVDDPGANAYGGTVAAPVFKEIARNAVVLYGIQPDKFQDFPSGANRGIVASGR